MAVLESPGGARPCSPEPAFGAADLVWEQVEEAAVRAYRAGGANAAFLHWERGLAVARARFDRADPRLGTSLANYAFALARRDEAFLSRRHFMLAREVFDAGWRWLGRMRPAGLRDRAYDPAALETFGRLVWELHRQAQAIELRGEPPIGRLERWREDRPAGGSDLRRLMAASLLLVSRPRE